MFIQNPVAGQLMIMGSLVFGKRYTGLTFWFPFALEWRSAVLMNAIYALVTTVGDSIGVSFEMHSGILE
jgi:hypothetical protein